MPAPAPSPAHAPNRSRAAAATLDLRSQPIGQAGTAAHHGPAAATTVLLATDREVLALGFGRILASAADLELVGVVRSRGQLFRAAADRAADIIVVDVHLDGNGGLEIDQRLAPLAAAGPGHWYLLDHVDARTVARLTRGGAAGFLHTAASAEQLCDALRHGPVASLVREAVAAQVDARDVLVPAAPAEPCLSDRDLELLDLLADGLTNREMAAALYLSEKTVKNCLSGLFRRLGVRSRTEAALVAAGAVGMLTTA